MTISLTTPIVIPNATRVKVTDLSIEDSLSRAVITVAVLSSPATGRVRRFSLTVRNGASASLAKNATADDWSNEFALGAVDTPTGYDEVEAAYRTGANKAAGFRAVETKLLAIGVLSADFAGTVA